MKKNRLIFDRESSMALGASSSGSNASRTVVSFSRPLIVKPIP